MKIEVLFPEICNLYGELENVRYLEKSCDDIELVETNINTCPLFVSEEPALIYMGTMTEKSQILAIERLMPYRDRIKELIEKGVSFLITGNALELFGKEIIDVNGTVVECLGIFDITARRDMMDRFNSLYLGTFEAVGCRESQKMRIVGFKSQFTHSYWGETCLEPLFITDRGPGLNPDIKGEGLRVNNFMATYIIGPLLVLNPPFARYILSLCGVEKPVLEFEEAAMEAYEARVKEYSDPGTGFYY